MAALAMHIRAKSSISTPMPTPLSSRSTIISPAHMPAAAPIRQAMARMLLTFSRQKDWFLPMRRLMRIY